MAFSKIGPACPPELAVTRFVAFLHVADVQRSIDFYAGLGMACRSQVGPEGRPVWASLRSAGGDLMLGQADGPVDPRIQAVMFYAYTPDLTAMRAHLLARGLRDGGPYLGDTPAVDPFPASGVVYHVRFPHYLPTGEMRVHDPDGYVVLIATSQDAAA